MMETDYFEKEYLVRSYECDEQYCVKFTSLVNYMQDISGIHSASVGLGAEELLDMNLSWILYKWKIRIYAYPRLGSVIRVRTWSSHMDKMFANRCYTLWNEEGEVIGEALSVWVMMDFSQRCACRIPQKIIDAYASTGESVSFAEEFTNNPLRLAGALLSQCDFTVYRHDLDYNRHLNNVKYMDYFLDTVPQSLLDGHRVYDLEVAYKRECPLGSKVTCLCFDSVNAGPEQSANQNQGGDATVIGVIKPLGEENNRLAHTLFQLKLR